MQQPTRTELATLGEFGLIERIKQHVKLENKSTVRGIGDDAAVINPDGLQTVISSDLFVEGIHFDLSYTPLKHLGYKAIAANVSDIAAMNATPTQILVNIAVSNRFSVEAIDELYEGIALACENYKVDLVGGDTASSRSGLVISVTAVGLAKPEQLVYRNTAKEGEVICVTGDLGAAYMGLQVLAREKQEFTANPEMQPQLSEKDYILRRQLKPEARTDIMYELRELGVQPTAMIDISDGLASEVMHLCKQSGIGALILEDELPIDNLTALTASEFGVLPVTCALNGGEDYELLFTLTQADYEKVRHHADITAIGITKKAQDGIYLMSKNGNAYPLKAQGWQHFQL